MDKIDWSKYQAVRRTSAYPSLFDEKRFTIQQLKEAAERASILFRGWPFILYRPYEPWNTHVVQDRLETIINPSDSPLGLAEEWNLLRSGAFLRRTVMIELSYEDIKVKKLLQERKLLDTTQTTFHVAEAIGSLWRLYEAFAVPWEEDLTIEFVYGDAQERELRVLNRNKAGYLDLLGKCYSPTVEVSRTLPLQLWRASDVDIAAEICLEIFQQFQWEPSLQHLQQEIGTFLGRTPASAR